MALLLMSAFVGCGGGSDSSEFPVASVERAVLDYYRAQPGLAGEVGRRIEGVKCNRAGTERGAEAFGCTINSVEGAGPVRFLARNDDGRLKVGAVDAGGEVAGAPKDARDAERRLLPSVLRSQQDIGVQGSELSCDPTGDAAYECTVTSGDGEPLTVVAAFNQDGTLARFGPIVPDATDTSGSKYDNTPKTRCGPTQTQGHVINIRTEGVSCGEARALAGKVEQGVTTGSCKLGDGATADCEIDGFACASEDTTLGDNTRRDVTCAAVRSQRVLFTLNVPA